MPHILTEITAKPLPKRRHRTSPREVKRARHNHYPIKKRDQPASTRHDGPPTINLHTLQPRAA